MIDKGFIQQFQESRANREIAKLMDAYWEEWEQFQQYAATVTGSLGMDLEDSKLARKASVVQKKAARLDKYSRGWRSAFNAYRQGKDIDTAKLIGSLAKFNSIMQGVAKDVERVAMQTMKVDLDLYKEVSDDVLSMQKHLEKTHDLGEQISHLIKSKEEDCKEDEMIDKEIVERLAGIREHLELEAAELEEVGGLSPVHQRQIDALRKQDADLKRLDRFLSEIVKEVDRARSYLAAFKSDPDERELHKAGKHISQLGAHARHSYKLIDRLKLGKY